MFSVLVFMVMGKICYAHLQSVLGSIVVPVLASDFSSTDTKVGSLFSSHQTASSTSSSAEA